MTEWPQPNGSFRDDYDDDSSAQFQWNDVFREGYDDVSWAQFLCKDSDDLWNPPPPFLCMDYNQQEQEQHNLEQSLIQDHVQVQHCHVPSIYEQASLAVPTQASSHTLFWKEKQIKGDESAAVQVVGFRTRSETTHLDDGYRWLKYGKKILRHNSNPRHYYRCMEHDCGVKKTVEKDPDDEGVVITIYRGTHNHFSPYALFSITEHFTLVVPDSNVPSSL